MHTIPDHIYTTRTLTFSELPEDDVPEHSKLGTLHIAVNYTDHPNDGMRTHKAVMLDHHVMPLLRRATNMDRALRMIAAAPIGVSVATLSTLVFNIKSLAREALKEVETTTNEQSESAA
jgi:hypothetical protein